MKIEALQVFQTAIQTFRAQYLSENHFQIRYNACHERGWSDAYLLVLGDVPIGYGCVKGMEALTDRDTIFEYYLAPNVRNRAGEAFEALIRASGAHYIECQTNEPLLTARLFEFAENIRAEVVLFGDGDATELTNPSCIFRQKTADDLDIFEHTIEPVGEYVLERDGDVVATGGFLLHYNPPFADLYMEVRQDCQRQGLGSFLLQELARVCRQSGRIPAARCNLQNRASRKALAKAGLREVGFMAKGQIKGFNRID